MRVLPLMKFRWGVCGEGEALPPRECRGVWGVAAPLVRLMNNMRGSALKPAVAR